MTVPGPITRATTMQVFGSDEQDVVDVDVLRWLRLAQLVLREERVPAEAEVSVVFIDRDSIADLNQRFLDGEGPTDVLAFPLGDDLSTSGRSPDAGGRGPGTPASPDELPLILGDVVVCPEVARDQARHAGRDLDDELALLVVHGLLHLLDYDHHDPDETAVMRRREQELLGRFRASEDAGSPPERAQCAEEGDDDGDQ